MTKPEQIILCGSGGQGIVIAGTILARAAFNEGKWIANMNSYGAAARGSACRAEVIISEKPISFPRVREADILIAMSQKACNAFVGLVSNEGLLIYDSSYVILEQQNPAQSYVAVQATRAAAERLSYAGAANIVMLGAVSAISGIVSKEALASSITESMKTEHVALNLRALEIGFRIGRPKGEQLMRREPVDVGNRR